MTACCTVLDLKGSSYIAAPRDDGMALCLLTFEGQDAVSHIQILNGKECQRILRREL